MTVVTSGCDVAAEKRAAGAKNVDERFDLIIIGGGIVGLATALEAQRRRPGRRVLVVEKEAKVGSHQTGHNSGVIHSGIYYKPGSLKAQTCVEGARRMMEFCREHGLPCRVVGKVVLATSEDERPALQELHRRGTANGVAGLKMMGAAELREAEPHAAGVAALRVPGTAITDYSLVAAKMAELVYAEGGAVRGRAKVSGFRASDGEQVVETTAGAYSAPVVVNCAGLYSDRICRLAGAEPEVRIIPFRGEYYSVSAAKRGLVRGLVYPVPDPKFPFLGVHLTPTVHGGLEAGPNAVLALAREGYRKRDVSVRDVADTLLFPGFWRMAARYWKSGLDEVLRSFSKRRFAGALQKLVPELGSEDLEAGGAGVRAQAVEGDGRLVDDFRIVRREGMVHVLNVPSPAATASLAIGWRIAEMIGEAAGV